MPSAAASLSSAALALTYKPISHSQRNESSIDTGNHCHAQVIVRWQVLNAYKLELATEQ